MSSFDRLYPYETVLCEPLARFQHDIELMRTTSDTWRLMRGFAESNGMRHVAFSFSSGFPAEKPDVFMLTTLPAEWKRRARFDPGMTEGSYARVHTSRKQTPFVFGKEYASSFPKEHGKFEQMIDLLSEFGVRSAIAFPLRQPTAPRFARMTFGNDMTREDFEAKLKETGLMLNVAAWHFSAHYLRLFREERIALLPLSEKQLEILRMVGEGMLDKQIAHTLGISFSAVRRRLESVMARLDLANRNEVAAEAVRRGVVRDRLFEAGPEETTVHLEHPD